MLKRSTALAFIRYVLRVGPLGRIELIKDRVTC